MRVGGHLQQADLPYQQKHPLILNRKSRLSLLLLCHLHTINHHAKATMILVLLSQHFYMAGTRTLVRAVSCNCIVCSKDYAGAALQHMGQLPEARFLPSPLFSRTGMDFAGPLQLKKGHTWKSVIVKGYVCLFICMSTSAVHMSFWQPSNVSWPVSVLTMNFNNSTIYFQSKTILMPRATILIIYVYVKISSQGTFLISVASGRQG